MATKKSETIATHDSKGNLTGSRATGGKKVPTVSKEKVAWGKAGQIVYPNTSAKDGSLTWETFSDIHPRYGANISSAKKNGYPICLHCGKGIKSGGWEIRMAEEDPQHFRAILPNASLDKDMVPSKIRTFLVGNDCATNVPVTHRVKADLINYNAGMGEK